MICSMHDVNISGIVGDSGCGNSGSIGDRHNTLNSVRHRRGNEGATPVE